ncbi:MAG: hypothetical protein J6T25_02470 [Bacilli bacterium]|nr:hypothetical protein [Bacilli bacterium]
MEKSKKVKIIGNSIFFSIITLMVFFFVWNYIDIKSGYKYPIFGLRKSVIVSPSMATVNDANTYITPEMKQIKKYDVVTTKQYKSFDSIKQYDIATYFAGSNTLICHRVIDKYIDESGHKYVVFRGDANNTNDAPVSYSLIRGKVVSISRGTGHFVAFIQSPYFFIAIFGVVFSVALGMFIIDHNKQQKALEAADGEPEPEETKPQEEPKVEEEPQPVEEEKAEEPAEEPAEETPVEEPVVEEPKEEKKAPRKRTSSKAKATPKEVKKED